MSGSDGHGEDMGSGKKLKNDGHKLIFEIFFLFLIKKIWSSLKDGNLNPPR